MTEATSEQHGNKVPRTQIKICGFTTEADARAVAELDIDAIGLVFYPPSPRFISVATARDIVAAIPPFLCVTALFLNASAAEIAQLLRHVPVNLLQFHGTEPVDFCESFERPYIKSVPMASVQDVSSVERYCADYVSARGFLLDSNALGAAGGTGEAFDWSLVPKRLSAPVILAGGIAPHNVAAAIAMAQPQALDVSSGVESAKGVKDRKMMQSFVDAVRAVG